MTTTMIEFGKEQEMLQGIASKFFQDKWSIEQVREQLTLEHSFDPKLWQEMAELGWMGVAVPEQYDGLGLGTGALVSLVEPMGRSLFASPFLSSQLVIQGILAGGTEEQKTEWLPKLAAGAVGALAVTEADGSWDLDQCQCRAVQSGERYNLSGVKTFVTDAPIADVFFVTVSLEGAPAIALVSKDQAVENSFAREVVIDETRRSYRMTLDGVSVDADALLTVEDARLALEAVAAGGMLLVSAEACGGAAGALALVIDYLNSRRQFGKLIGSYQALKHPTVDILIGLERSRSHLYHAASVFGTAAAKTALRMLKAESTDAFVFAGDRAIQFHGGVGFTYECDAQLYLRRAIWCQYQFGDALHHRKKLASSLF